MNETTTKDQDSDRLEILDRIEARIPEIKIEDHAVEWETLDDGAEALLLDHGGFDGGAGAFVCLHGDDLHFYGSLAPLIEGLGCIVIKPDGSRYVARAVRDPLAE
jgi:hypothetical protein